MALEISSIILNPQLASFYHFAQKGNSPKILIEDLKLYPILVATLTQQRPIVNLVDRILAAKKADSQADTSTWEAVWVDGGRGEGG